MKPLTNSAVTWSPVKSVHPLPTGRLETRRTILSRRVVDHRLGDWKKRRAAVGLAFPDFACLRVFHDDIFGMNTTRQEA